MRRSASRQQQTITFRTHGGRRRGAGRKPSGPVAGVSHGTRPELSGREPVLVTMKMRPHVWNLRTKRALGELLPAFFAARDRLGVRLIQFTVQGDHLHLMVEPQHALALSRAMQGLSVRIARALNRMMRRKGKVFADRFHSRVLATPRQVRTAMAYVLCNGTKHGHAPRGRPWLDPFSSAHAFDGWLGLARDPECIAARIVVAPRTWLASIGWRRAGGPIDPSHRPGALPS